MRYLRLGLVAYLTLLFGEVLFGLYQMGVGHCEVHCPVPGWVILSTVPLVLGFIGIALYGLWQLLQWAWRDA